MGISLTRTLLQYKKKELQGIITSWRHTREKEEGMSVTAIVKKQRMAICNGFFKTIMNAALTTC